LRLFAVVEQLLGRQINGQVLDIGCGSGYSAVWLARNRPVEKVYALEATRNAVENLIPQTIRSLDAPAGKVVPTLGSFNRIPYADHFDFIVSFGAIHHSSDLWTTISECYKALRPGGAMICQEPVSPDLTSNQAFLEMYAQEEEVADFGIMTKGERDDHFFRGCEYKTAMHFAGFEIRYFQDCYSLMHPINSVAGLRQRINRFLSSGRGTVRPHLMVLSKPALAQEIPHRWKALA
jgi:SAM-dependent methyltransferase